MSKFGGTWVEYGVGRTLMGVDTNDSDFNAADKTGGEKTHTLTENEMPEHLHGIGNDTVGYVLVSNMRANGSFGYIPQFTNSITGDLVTKTNKTGKSQPHNNLQPYITVYMYKRAA